jgi:uncharacterized protein
MFTPEQIVLLVTPPVLLASTFLAYRGLVARFGLKRGYFGGFLFYWLAWCLLLPLALLGPGGLGALFRNVAPRYGDPAWLGLLLLLFPLLLGYGFAFPRAVRGAGWTLLLVSAAIAVVNGTLEEVVWRGTYVALFPEGWVLGMVFPAIGFGLWHLAPQSVLPSRYPGGEVALVVVSGIVGLMWGWVAHQARSIVWVTVSHVLFDFSGLGGRVYLR